MAKSCGAIYQSLFIRAYHILSLQIQFLCVLDDITLFLTNIPLASAPASNINIDLKNI